MTSRVRREIRLIEDEEAFLREIGIDPDEIPDDPEPLPDFMK